MLIPKEHKGCVFAVQEITGVPNMFSIWGVHTSAREAQRDEVGGMILNAVLSPQYNIIREIVYINNHPLLSVFIYKRYGGCDG